MFHGLSGKSCCTFTCHIVSPRASQNLKLKGYLLARKDRQVSEKQLSPWCSYRDGTAPIYRPILIVPAEVSVCKERLRRKAVKVRIDIPIEHFSSSLKSLFVANATGQQEQERLGDISWLVTCDRQPRSIDLRRDIRG